MSNINFNEIKEEICNGTFDNDKIEIEDFIGYQDKKTFVAMVLSACIYEIENTGEYYIDILQKQMTIEMGIITFYTNIDFGDMSPIEYVENYDIIKKYNIYQFVKHTVRQSDFNDLMSFIDQNLALRVKKEQSIEDIVEKFLNKIITQLPNVEVLKELMDHVKNYSDTIGMDRINAVKEIISINKKV